MDLIKDGTDDGNYAGQDLPCMWQPINLVYPPIQRHRLKIISIQTLMTSRSMTSPVTLGEMVKARFRKTR